MMGLDLQRLCKGSLLASSTNKVGELPPGGIQANLGAQTLVVWKNEQLRGGGTSLSFCTGTPRMSPVFSFVQINCLFNWGDAAQGLGWYY